MTDATGRSDALPSYEAAEARLYAATRPCPGATAAIDRMLAKAVWSGHTDDCSGGCNGTGTLPLLAPELVARGCPRCDGRGCDEYEKHSPGRHTSDCPTPCPECGGEGEFGGGTGCGGGE